MASSEIEFYVKLQSGKTITLRYLPSRRVDDIVNEVSKELGPSSDRRVRIKYNGKVLDETKTIGYLGVCKETILKTEILIAKNLNLNIRSKETTTPLSISNFVRVDDLKTKISALLDIEESHAALRFGGRTITGKQTIFDAGITDGASIDVEVKVKEEKAVAKTDTDEPLSEETRQEVLSSFDNAGKSVEVVFSFDTTGSMYSCLEEVRRKITESCNKLLRDIPNIRIGVIAHGDYCDYNNYVQRNVDLTSDPDVLSAFVTSVPATGGGDTPECYEWALRTAQQLDWAENSAKALIMIGDAPPHPPSYTDLNLNWHDELDVLKGMGVNVSPAKSDCRVGLERGGWSTAVRPRRQSHADLTPTGSHTHGNGRLVRSVPDWHDEIDVLKDMDVKVYGIHALNQHQSKPFYEELALRTGGCYLKLREFSLITDMFLAVCYRESSPEQLEAFCEEVKEEGRMTDETQKMFEDLGKAQPVPRSTAGKYVREPWWDPCLDNGTPSSPGGTLASTTGRRVTLTTRAVTALHRAKQRASLQPEH